MNDYRFVRWGGGGRYRRVDVGDTAGWHAAERAAIFRSLAEPFGGPRLVMTHHAPSPLCLPPHRASDLVSAAYASDLTDAVRAARVDVWIHGHVHDAEEVDVAGANGTTRIRSNPRGYPGERTRFDPTRVIEL